MRDYKHIPRKSVSMDDAITLKEVLCVVASVLVFWFIVICLFL